MQQCGDWAWGGRSAAWPPEPRVPPPPVENFTPPVRFETVWGPCDTVCSAALFTDYTHWRRSLDRERRHVEHRKVTASGTRRPGLLSLSVLSMQAAISTWRKPGGVNRHIDRVTHQPVHVVAQCSLVPSWWLASGDQRRLTGSGGALETCSWRCAIQMAAFTLLTYYSSIDRSLSRETKSVH